MSEIELSCKLCKITFKSRSNFNDHKKNVHGKNGSRKCTHCNSEYRQLNNFIVHFKKVHLDRCDNKNCVSIRRCDLCTAKLNEVKKKWSASERVLKTKPIKV